MNTDEIAIQRKTLNDGKKYLLLIASIISMVLFFIGIFFIDNRWWWSLFFVIPICITTLNAFKDNIDASPQLKNRISYAISWITFYTFIFVLVSAIFITPQWWFGLFLVLTMMGVLGSFEMELGDNVLPFLEKKRIAIIMLSFFLMTFLLFCIPSFVANSNKNPDNTFHSDWSTVESYSIYGTGASNMEHIIARSWYITDEHYVNDYVNVIWSNQEANNARGNLPFGNVKKNSTNTVYENDILIGYKDDKYFMPTDEYKGDVARILLYMYVTYKDDDLDNDYINVGLMKKWSRQDPVDSREKERNRIIESSYGYYNKFVKTPWLVGFVV